MPSYPASDCGGRREHPLLGLEARWGSRESKGFGTNATVRKRRCLFSWVITFTFIGRVGAAHAPQARMEHVLAAAGRRAGQEHVPSGLEVRTSRNWGCAWLPNFPPGACSTHSNFIA